MFLTLVWTVLSPCLVKVAGEFVEAFVAFLLPETFAELTETKATRLLGDGMRNLAGGFQQFAAIQHKNRIKVIMFQ